MTLFYARLPTGTTDASDLKAATATFCTTHGLDGPSEAFVDAYFDADTPWPDRPAGRRLFERLDGHPSDVVITCGSQIWTTTSGVAAFGKVLALGSTIHLVDHNATFRPAHGPTFEAIVSALDRWRSVNRGEAISEGMRRRKVNGRRYCHRPPLGFRWSGKSGNQTLRLDDDEWNMMKRMWKWWRQGFSHEVIYWHLRRNDIVRLNSREWSLTSIKRATKCVEDWVDTYAANAELSSSSSAHTHPAS